MTIQRYTNADRKLWNDFVCNSKNGLFMFDRSFMEYHKDRFTDYSLLFYDDDKLLAIFPASVKDCILSSHGGLTYGGFITGNDMKQHKMNDCFSALKDYAAQNGIKEIVYKHIPHIYHKQPAEEDLYTLFCCRAAIKRIEAVTVVNLQDRLKMDERRRRMMKKACKAGVTVEESIDFDTFIALENDVLQKYHNTTAVHTGAELVLLHEHFPKEIKLYAGFLRGRMVAGTVLFIYDNVVHTQYLAADDTAREIGALDLVIATLMEKYAAKKTWFDFGKSTEGDGTFLNEGLIAQKEGFGGRTFVYQTWEIVI